MKVVQDGPTGFYTGNLSIIYAVLEMLYNGNRKVYIYQTEYKILQFPVLMDHPVLTYSRRLAGSA